MIASEDRIREFIGRRRQVWFNVAPRYTSGSPALVPMDTALRVARQERKSYEDALRGRYGDDDRQEALEKGLSGIAEIHYETRKGWDVLDLCTSERFIRPFSRVN